MAVARICRHERLFETMAITTEELIGTWRLLNWTQRRGDEEILPMGEAPVGWITYTSYGWMSVNIMRRDRPEMRSGDFVTASEHEKAAAFASYLGYAGTYELRGDRVLHRIACASYPNWTRQEQVRRARLSEGILTLNAAARIVDGVSITATLVWTRDDA